MAWGLRRPLLPRVRAVRNLHLPEVEGHSLSFGLSEKWEMGLLLLTVDSQRRSILNHAAIRTATQLPRYDSNVDCLVQSQECYQLHHGAKLFSINKKPQSLRRAL